MEPLIVTINPGWVYAFVGCLIGQLPLIFISAYAYNIHRKQQQFVNTGMAEIDRLLNTEEMNKKTKAFNANRGGTPIA